MRREFFKNKSAQIGIALGAVLLAFVLLVPVFSSYGADAQNPPQKLKFPNNVNLLGTDQFGRDLLTRVAVGGQRSLGAALIVLTITVLISLFIGIIVGLIGGFIDAAVMRAADVLLAFPQLILALAIVGVLGVGFQNLLVALVISSLAFYIRLARSYALTAKNRPDIIVARLAGISWTRIILTHIAPDTLRQMLIVATLDLGGIIVNIAALSFLGLGAQPPEAEWGAMLNEAKFFFTTAPHLLLAPSAAILLAVISANLIGNALRDVRDTQ